MIFWQTSMHFKANKLLAYRKVKRNKVFNILLACKGIRIFDAFFFLYTRVMAFTFIHSLFCHDESREDNSERELMLRFHRTGPDPVTIESDRISLCLHNNNNNNDNNKTFLLELNLMIIVFTVANKTRLITRSLNVHLPSALLKPA